MILYIINDLPTTEYSYIHRSPNQVGIHQKFTHAKQEHYIIDPKHSGESKIGRYMTLIIKEIHDIETKYLRQDYDSHQQLTSKTSINHHSDQQPVFVH